jgi:hypothetical protein
MSTKKNKNQKSEKVVNLTEVRERKEALRLSESITEGMKKLEAEKAEYFSRLLASISHDKLHELLCADDVSVWFEYDSDIPPEMQDLELTSDEMDAIEDNFCITSDENVEEKFPERIAAMAKRLSLPLDIIQAKAELLQERDRDFALDLFKESPELERYLMSRILESAMNIGFTPNSYLGQDELIKLFRSIEKSICDKDQMQYCTLRVFLTYINVLQMYNANLRVFAEAADNDFRDRLHGLLPSTTKK